MEIEQSVGSILAGSCFVAFTQLATRDEVSGMLAAAWYILALATPILAGVSVEPFPEQCLDASTFTIIRIVLYFLSAIGALVAFGLIFEQLHRGAGAAFGISCLGSLGLLRHAVRQRKARDKKPQ